MSLILKPVLVLPFLEKEQCFITKYTKSLLDTEIVFWVLAFFGKGKLCFLDFVGILFF